MQKSKSHTEIQIAEGSDVDLTLTIDYSDSFYMTEPILIPQVSAAK